MKKSGKILSHSKGKRWAKVRIFFTYSWCISKYGPTASNFFITCLINSAVFLIPVIRTGTCVNNVLSFLFIAIKETPYEIVCDRTKGAKFVFYGIDPATLKYQVQKVLPTSCLRQQNVACYICVHYCFPLIFIPLIQDSSFYLTNHIYHRCFRWRIVFN